MFFLDPGIPYYGQVSAPASADHGFRTAQGDETAGDELPIHAREQPLLKAPGVQEKGFPVHLPFQGDTFGLYFPGIRYSFWDSRKKLFSDLLPLFSLKSTWTSSRRTSSFSLSR